MLSCIFQITLESLLQKYMSSERLNDVECDGCRRLNDGVPKKATFIKTSSIGKVLYVGHFDRVMCSK